jgi:hypothetical protein
MDCTSLLALSRSPAAGLPRLKLPCRSSSCSPQPISLETPCRPKARCYRSDCVPGPWSGTQLSDFKFHPSSLPPLPPRLPPSLVHWPLLVIGALFWQGRLVGIAVENRFLCCRLNADAEEANSTHFMKTISHLLCCSLLIVANAARAETLFGTGTIIIATNQTLLITTLAGTEMYSPLIKLIMDGVDITPQPKSDLPGFLAVSGPHTLVVTNADEHSSEFFVSFQRLTNSPIRTVLTVPNSTNFISVSAGKTIQLLPPLGAPRTIQVQPQNSTNWFACITLAGFPSLSISGPVTIAIAVQDYGNNLGTALSYFFTDDLVQFPPSGLLTVPAPILQVNVEKSYDFTNWTPTATFHTEAEAKAFYRLRMLK